MSIDDDVYIDDDWPTMPDGSDFDGKHLLTLVRSGKSPFDGAWDVDLLIRDLEKSLGTQVVDIPEVTCGANNYGIHFSLSNRQDVVVRLARGDVNMPRYGGCKLQVQAAEVEFEAAVYGLLRSEPGMISSRLLYHHVPVRKKSRTSPPQDISGRRMFVFEKSEGRDHTWQDFSPQGKISLLRQAARIRASLFNFRLPLNFATVWLCERLFERRSERRLEPVVETREFCMALLACQIETTLGAIEPANHRNGSNGAAAIGPLTAAIKTSLLRLIPHLLPIDDDNRSSLYRFVLEHGDFGIHNMSVAVDANKQPMVTSLYDWEAGSVVPAILSDPMMAVSVDMVIDDEGGASWVPRTSRLNHSSNRHDFPGMARQYFEVLFDDAPDYKHAIQEGKDARHLWFSLRGWRGEDAESYFGCLGAWAGQRMKNLGI